MFVYDLEVENSPLPLNVGTKVYKSANGWSDYVGMGLSVLCGYSYSTRQDVTLFKNELSLLDMVIGSDVVIGFNIIGFDNRVLRALGYNIDDNKCYDILVELWNAHGITGPYNKRTHSGFSLDVVAKANGIDGKSGSGAMAPVLFQDNRIEELVEYCKNDVAITKSLVDIIFDTGGLISPKTKTFHRMRLPA